MKKVQRTVDQRKTASKPDMEFLVTEPDGLLDFLLFKLSDQSRNHVKSLLTHRDVSVDDVVVTRYDTLLHEGQKIRINRTHSQKPKQKNVLDIIYEDSDIIVINKPAGLLSIASDKEKNLTAYHLLTDYVKQKDPGNRIFAVHRLDRDTSGVFMVAKNEEIKLALQDNWANLVSERAYIAVVEGQLQEKNGRIQSWLKETKTLFMYSSLRAGDGLKAITDYRVIRESAEYSLLDIHLQTGRKNQIRVHMKDLGHLVVGDKKYGARSDPFRRLGLHACKLSFRHPVSGKLMCFESLAPSSFQSLFIHSEQTMRKV